MLYKLFFIGFIYLGILGNVSAQSFWLNMVSDGESMSLPVQSGAKCTEAVISYVRSNIVSFVSYDVEPLHDAINLVK